MPGHSTTTCRSKSTLIVIRGNGSQLGKCGKSSHEMNMRHQARKASSRTYFLDAACPSSRPREKKLSHDSNMQRRSNRDIKATSWTKHLHQSNLVVCVQCRTAGPGLEGLPAWVRPAFFFYWHTSSHIDLIIFCFRKIMIQDSRDRSLAFSFRLYCVDDSLPPIGFRERSFWAHALKAGEIEQEGKEKSQTKDLFH